MNPIQIQTYSRTRDVVGFARDVLGLKDIEEHTGQVRWLRNSWKLINILKPANQWGKTLAESVLHIYHAMCKPMLIGRVSDDLMWSQIRYETVNVGKTYEVAKGVFETAMDIIGGKILMKDGTTNVCDLGWAISHVEDAMNKPPEIHWWNGSKTLIRSYDEFGSSFKRKRLAFVSVDETGDIPELKLFLNGTLIPRVFFFRGPIHLVGTSQSAGVEYEEVAEIATENIKSLGDQSDFYFQTGSVFENPNIDPEFIRKLEAIADPELKKQIIYGQYVDYGDKIYTYDEVTQLFSEPLPWDEKSGFSEVPQKDGKYVFSVDMAATKDETSITCVRHGLIHTYGDGKKIDLPYRVVFHKAFKGETMPLSLQYDLIHQWYAAFKTMSPGGTKFVFDAMSLGGKNTQQAFSDLHGFPFPGGGASYMNAKAEAIGTFKEVLGKGRKFIINEKGQQVDENRTWGGLRIPPKMITLRRQIEGYKLDDKNIKQDRFMSLIMAIHYIEKRKPTLSHNRAVDLDVMGGVSLGR